VSVSFNPGLPRDACDIPSLSDSNISFVMVPEFEGREEKSSCLLNGWVPQESSLTDAVVAATIVLVLPDGPDSVTIKVEPGVPNGDTVEVMEGSSVTFSAETESYPQASYSWFFSNDSKPITWSLFFNMSNVTIPAVSKEHEGTYACLVSNAAAQKSLRDAVKVRVLGESLSPIPLLCVSENQGCTDVLELEEDVVERGLPLWLVADCGSGHREDLGPCWHILHKALEALCGMSVT